MNQCPAWLVAKSHQIDTNSKSYCDWAFGSKISTLAAALKIRHCPNHHSMFA